MSQDIFDQITASPKKAAGSGDIFDEITGAAADVPEEMTIAGFLKNLLASSGKFAGDVTEAVIHPIRTTGALAGLAAGSVEKLVPNQWKTGAEGAFTHEQYVDALAKMYKDRYGSMDQFMRAFYSDPMSVMADIATVAGGAGIAGRGVKLAAESLGLTDVALAAEKGTEVAGAVARAADPLNLPVHAARGANAAVRATTGVDAGAAIGAKVSNVAEKLYQSALKPPPATYTTEEVGELVGTALRERIPVSESGYQKLSSLIKRLNEARGRLVENAPTPEMEVSLRNPRRIGAGNTELGPIPPPAGTRQAVTSEPELATSFTSRDQYHVPQGELGPGRPQGAGRYAVDVEKGRTTPLPVVTRPNVTSTADEVVDAANRGRGFSISDNRFPGGVDAESYPKLPTRSTQVTGRESATSRSRNQAAVDAELEAAKNAQLIDVINARAEESGLLAAVQDAAHQAGRRAPSKVTDLFDIKMKNVIWPQDVAKQIDKIKGRFRSVNPEADLSALDNAKAEFLRNYPNPLSYQEAQKIKSNTYSVIGDRSYMEKASKTRAATEAEKSLAHGLMEELEIGIPEIAGINAREGPLLDLVEPLQRAINRTRNWEQFGIQTGIVATGAGVVTGSAEAAAIAGLMAAVLRDPNMKSRLAIAINIMTQKKTGVSPGLAASMSRVDNYINALQAYAAQPGK